MRTLLLTSAGMNVKDELVKILPKPPQETTLAHIITASKAEDDTSYVKKDERFMKEVGFNVVTVDIEGKTESELRDILKDVDVIFVQGGNTFYLLKHVRESGFDNVVNELVDQGKIYVGVSAGTVIACPTIEVAGWKNADRNVTNLTDFTGLNFVPFLIFVHYTEDYRDIVKEFQPKTKYPVRILTDDQAFLVRDDEVMLVGKGEEVAV